MLIVIYLYLLFHLYIYLLSLHGKIHHLAISYDKFSQNKHHANFAWPFGKAFFPKTFPRFFPKSTKNTVIYDNL